MRRRELLLAAGSSWLVLGAAPPRVLGPEVQPRFAAMMARINREQSLGPGALLTGISLQRASVSLRFLDVHGNPREVILQDGAGSSAGRKGRWFVVRMAGEGGPDSEVLLGLLARMLDETFPDDPYRAARDEQTLSPTDRDKAVQQLPHDRQFYGFGRVLVAAVASAFMLAVTLRLVVGRQTTSR